MTGARTLMWAVLVTLAQLLDVGVLDRQPAFAAVDLLLLVVVAAALAGGSVAGATIGLLAGLLADLTPPGAGLLGIDALAYGLAGAVAGRWHRRGGRTAGPPLPLALAAAGVAALAANVVHLVVGLGRQQVAQASLTCVTAAGAAVVVGVVALPALSALDRRVGEDLP